jgi:malate permease and related proteins
MEEMAIHVSGVVAPVLLCALVGYGLAMFKLPFDNKIVGSLVANVGYPTLIISHLTKQHIQLDAFLEMMLAAFASMVAFGVVGFGLLKILRLPVRGFLSPMMLNNVGNVGLPICALAFGAQGLAYALAFVVVVLAGIFTIGMWLPMGKITPSDILKKPVIYAVVITIVLMATDTRLPRPIGAMFDILGGLAIPLMLLTLGHTLATLNVGLLRRGGALAVLHLAMAAGVAYALVPLFGFTGSARGVFILECVMPVSIATYLWIEMYDPEDAPTVAGFILISTLLTVVVTPLVLAYWI